MEIESRKIKDCVPYSTLGTQRSHSYSMLTNFWVLITFFCLNSLVHCWYLSKLLFQHFCVWDPASDPSPCVHSSLSKILCLHNQEMYSGFPNKCTSTSLNFFGEFSRWYLLIWESKFIDLSFLPPVSYLILS